MSRSVENFRKWQKKRQADPEYRRKHSAYNIAWSKTSKGRIAAHRSGRKAHLGKKTDVLTRYSPNGMLGCSWDSCTVTDVDMLTLDHIYNDGAEHRKTVGGGAHTYRWVVKNDYPEGFQTLCANHQLKKEILRKRGS